jgi:hypothetical protein
MACPDCPTALEARSLVTSEFATGLWQVLLPFAIALLVVHWIARVVDRGFDA